MSDNPALHTSLPASEAAAAIRYITLPEHAQFMGNLEAQLQSICAEDPALSKATTLPKLLSCCPADNTKNRQLRFNHQVAAYLQSTVDHHHGRAFRLNVHLLDGQTTAEAFVRPADSLRELKSSIERCIELRVRMNSKTRKEEEGSFSHHRHLNWAHVWRRYDLWIDRRQRVQMNCEPVSSSEPDNVVGLVDQDRIVISQTIIANHSKVEFIHRRSH